MRNSYFATSSTPPSPYQGILVILVILFHPFHPRFQADLEGRPGCPELSASSKEAPDVVRTAETATPIYA